MGSLLQCRQLKITAKSFCQFGGNAMVSNIRRAYHQYKPKDRPIIHQTTQSIDAHITRDVLLYRYEEPLKVFGLNTLAFMMLPIWSFLSYEAFKLKDYLESVKNNVSSPTTLNLMSLVQKANNGVAVGFFLFGAGISGYWLTRTSNTVRRLILKKGGKHVTVITYGSFGPYNRSSTFPVQHLSSVRHPDNSRLFLRVKDQYFKYQLNMNHGIFGNRPLFDRTVGISRNI